MTQGSQRIECLFCGKWVAVTPKTKRVYGHSHIKGRACEGSFMVVEDWK